MTTDELIRARDDYLANRAAFGEQMRIANRTGAANSLPMMLASLRATDMDDARRAFAEGYAPLIAELKAAGLMPSRAGRRPAPPEGAP